MGVEQRWILGSPRILYLDSSWDKTELYCTHEPSPIFCENMEEIDLLGYLGYDPIVGNLALSLITPL